MNIRGEFWENEAVKNGLKHEVNIEQYSFKI